jgi:hypothetical protein
MFSDAACWRSSNSNGQTAQSHPSYPWAPDLPSPTLPAQAGEWRQGRWSTMVLVSSLASSSAQAGRGLGSAQRTELSGAWVRHPCYPIYPRHPLPAQGGEGGRVRWPSAVLVSSLSSPRTGVDAADRAERGLGSFAPCGPPDLPSPSLPSNGRRGQSSAPKRGCGAPRRHRPFSKATYQAHHQQRSFSPEDEQLPLTGQRSHKAARAFLAIRRGDHEKERSASRKRATFSLVIGCFPLLAEGYYARTDFADLGSVDCAILA